MLMPAPTPSILSRRADIASALRRILPASSVIDDPAALAAYECDALSVYRQLPLIAVLPETSAQVAATLKLCRDLGVNIVPRGAGTSLSGGALPLADGVTVGLSKLDRILDIDYANRCVVAQAGVANLAITRAVEGRGFHYAPDPSSQVACTIGGNVAENSGGVHCLKYGLTTNNLLGLEMALIDGSLIRLGGRHLDAGGLDLMGVVTGSEGLLGIVTEVTVRILPRPETARALLIAFPSLESAGRAVAGIISAGIIPAGLEMMDKAAVAAAEDYCHAGYPLEAEALLIAELDGPAVEVDHLLARVAAIARAAGASGCEASTSEAQRLRFWAGRKAAFPAVAQIAPDYFCMDGTIPRHRLPEVLTRLGAMAAAAGLGLVNVFHAGDGNLHPLIMFDANRPGELARAEALGADILRLCVEVGGVLTGEHGVGVEKRDLMEVMFDQTDLAHQQRLKCAFDPDGLFNPGKVYPTLHRCAELGQVHVHGGQLRFPELPRF